MNLPLYIARRIDQKGAKTFSKAIIQIAIYGIVIGMSVMIISIYVLFGFQDKIIDKVVGMSAHMLVTKYDNNESFDKSPFSSNNVFSDTSAIVQKIRHIQGLGIKTCIMRTDEGVSGVVLKGVGDDYDFTGLRNQIIHGTLPIYKDTANTHHVVISKKISDKMKIKTGDDFILFFAQDPPRFRKMKVSGIYETGLEEFDDKLVIGNIELIRRINGWKEDEVNAMEIYLKDERQINSLYQQVYDGLSYDLELETSYDLYFQLFDWLKLLDRNVMIIIVLVLIVAGFNFISALLVMILERINMIGVLKTLGFNNFSIQKIFIHIGMRILFRGLFWGNIIGLVLCWVQYYFKIIPLQSENYYMHYVPVKFNFFVLLLLNVGTLCVTFIFLYLPSLSIRKIAPIRAIRMD